MEREGLIDRCSPSPRTPRAHSSHPCTAEIHTQPADEAIAALVENHQWSTTPIASQKLPPPQKKPQSQSPRYLVGAVEVPHEEEVVPGGGGSPSRRRGARGEQLVRGVERDEDHRGGAGDLDLPAGREEEPERRRRRRRRGRRPRLHRRHRGGGGGGEGNPTLPP